MTKTIEVPEYTLQVLLLESFRHCLGRQTYAVSECVEALMKYWSVLPEAWQKQIKQDIGDAMKNGTYGHLCDLKEWEKILDFEVGS